MSQKVSDSCRSGFVVWDHLRDHRLYSAGVVIAKYQWHENEDVQIERWCASFNCRHDLFHIMLNMLNKEKNIFCGFLVASYLWIFRAANVSDALMSCLIRLYEFCIHYNSDFIITGNSRRNKPRFRTNGQFVSPWARGIRGEGRL